MEFFEKYLVEYIVGGILLWLFVNLQIIHKANSNAEIGINDYAERHNWSELEVLSHLRQMSIDTGIKRNEYLLISILGVMLVFVYKLLV